MKKTENMPGVYLRPLTGERDREERRERGRKGGGRKEGGRGGRREERIGSPNLPIFL